MSVRITFCAALAAAMLVPALTSAQDVDTKLNQIIENMVTRDDLKNLATKDELKSEVDKLTTLVNEQEAKIKSMRGDLDNATELLNEELTKQKQIIDVISRSDSQGRPILALNNIMENSPEFKQEVSKVVNQSLGTEGTLVVQNKTSFDRQLRINHRNTEVIPANSTKEFQVSVGTVTTELIGDEAPKNWTIAAPTYRQKIDIEPLTSTVVVQRPMVSESIVVQRPVVNETVYVQRPVVVQSPVVSETVFVQRPVVVQSPVVAAPAPVFLPAPVVATPSVVYERRGLFGRRLVPRFVY